ncbi:MAG: hypothetical protein U5L11_04605 [Arhodomonas sp.]|nr:hypothetical protein [Arhodomonas sp.]
MTGDVITSVNRRPVRSVSELEGIAQGQSQLLLRVRRGDSALFMVLRD